MSSLALVLLAYVLFTIGSVIFCLGFLLYALARRIPVEEFGIQIGPALVRFRVLGLPVRINAFPLGCYVKYFDRDDRDPMAEVAVAGRLLEDRHPLDRIAMMLSGPAVLVLCALPLAGPAGLVDAFLPAMSQFVRGAVHPYDVGAPLVASYFGVLGDHQYAAATGTLWTKLVAMNLLPIPTLVGGMIAMELVEAAARRRLPSSAKNWILLAGTLAVFASGACWALATVRAARHA